MKLKAQITYIINEWNNEQGNTYLLNLKDENEKQYNGVYGQVPQKLKVNDFYEFNLYDNNKIKGKKNFNEVVKVNPTNHSQIKNLLTNAKNIGAKTVDKLISQIPETEIQNIFYNTDLINKTTLTTKQKQSLIEFLKQYKEDEDLAKLEQLQIGYNNCISILNKMREEGIENPYEAIKENPYLLTIYSNLAFEFIDSIALQFLTPESHIRLENGLLYILKQNQAQGHTTMNKDLAIVETCKLLNVKRIFIEQSLFEFSWDYEFNNLKKSYTIYNNNVSLTNTYIKEERVKYLLNKIYNKNSKKYDVEDDIKEFEEEKEITLNEEQREAVISSFNSNITIVYGGAGVGKTKVQQCITYILNKKNLTFRLMAPTGKAASRLKDVTGFETSTIHRGLGYKFSNGMTYEYNEDNPFEEDYLIIDEFSMADLNITLDLLSASLNSRLIIIGDDVQLPSVKYGAILRDLINCNKFTAIKLTQVYRQGKGSLIIENATRIREGRPILHNHLGTQLEDDFRFIVRDEEEILPLIQNLLDGNLKKTKGFESKDIQILTPIHKGIFGNTNLNKVAQAIQNKEKKSLKIGKEMLVEYKIGDKVIYLVNNDDIQVYNGDTGFVSSIAQESLTVDFNGQMVVIPQNEIKDVLLHAYSLTVHKSQGSEFDCVIIPIVKQAHMMLYMELVYTAITRGAKFVLMIGNPNLLNNMYNNPPRNTNLQSLLNK